MKKLLKILVALLLFVTIEKIYASTITLTYSDWSLMYPSGLDESFIESEVRYKWYKFNNNEVEYVDDYYTNLDGYIKDEGSQMTFYRYITNRSLIFNAFNEMVFDTDFCVKNFCYIKLFTEPTLIDTTTKVESKYSETPIYEYTSEVVPYTGDKVMYFVITLILSSLILLIVVKKKKKMSYE